MNNLVQFCDCAVLGSTAPQKFCQKRNFIEATLYSSTLNETLHPHIDEALGISAKTKAERASSLV